MQLRSLIRVLLAVSLFSSQCLAQTSLGDNYRLDELYRSRLSEYFYNITGKEVLHPIRLLGSVKQPGLYHVPKDTNLTTLLAIAGGPTREADTEELHVRKENGDYLKINLDKNIRKGKDTPLQSGDIIYMSEKKGWFDQATTSNITVAASFITALATLILVIDNNND